jgi:nonsense-mediated mRNA decay protein 3
MAFCVECGAEGATLEGLCADDFVRIHPLFRAPERIDIPKCAHCGKLELPRGWMDSAVEDAIPGLLAANVTTDRRVANPAYAWTSRREHENVLGLTVRSTCTVGAWDHLTTTFRTRVRVRGGACPTCSKRSADYFAGTVQVRADGRPLTEDEQKRAERVADAAASGGDDFVSRIETVRGGIDVKVGTNGFAKRLARDLAKEFGGTVGSSATLHTQREGREVYRSTYVVRLPAFHEGDVVRWRGARYRVESVGDSVSLRHVETGATERVRIRELGSARLVQEPATRRRPSAP